jgi:hypothetical protein
MVMLERARCGHAASDNGSAAAGPVVACPVCNAVLPLASAAEHEHLRAGAAVASP